MIAEQRAPNLPLHSATVLGWLATPPSTVAGWDAQDWEAARWAVQVHGIAPLLDRAAAHWPDATLLHPLLRQYLTDQRQRSGQRVALLLRDLAELLAACHAHNIAVMPLKGGLLATTYYAEPGLRPMSDLDLLVHPSDEPRMLALLAELRYEPLARGWKHVMLARPEAHGPVVAYDGEHPNNPRSLDLHIRLAEQFWGIQYDLTAEAWADSAPGELLGSPTQLLRPATLLHHLAIHASSDAIARRLRLLHLHDIALVAPAVDRAGWAGMLAGAQARGEERLVYPALALTQRYYPAAVPDDLLLALRAGVPQALLRHLDANALDRYSFCNSAPTTPAEKLCWFRPGRERAAALRHMLLPDPAEMAHWYPHLSRTMLLPLAYARYGATLLGWGIRRALGKPRLRPNSQ
jgi:hypothetical protein